MVLGPQQLLPCLTYKGLTVAATYVTKYLCIARCKHEALLPSCHFMYNMLLDLEPLSSSTSAATALTGCKCLWCSSREVSRVAAECC